MKGIKWSIQQQILRSPIHPVACFLFNIFSCTSRSRGLSARFALDVWGNLPKKYRSSKRSRLPAKKQAQPLERDASLGVCGRGKMSVRSSGQCRRSMHWFKKEYLFFEQCILSCVSLKNYISSPKPPWRVLGYSWAGWGNNRSYWSRCRAHL